MFGLAVVDSGEAEGGRGSGQGRARKVRALSQWLARVASSGSVRFRDHVSRGLGARSGGVRRDERMVARAISFAACVCVSHRRDLPLLLLLRVSLSAWVWRQSQEVFGSASRAHFGAEQAFFQVVGCCSCMRGAVAICCAVC